MIADYVLQAEPCAVEPPPRRSILIVDDDPEQVTALEYRLSKLGFNVLKAFDGQSALEIALRERPAVVLLDVRLPDRAGLEVCAELADAPETCGTPVIVLSGIDDPQIVRRARSAGCEYYVRKPYDPNVLLALIERALQGESEA